MHTQKICFHFILVLLIFLTHSLFLLGKHAEKVRNCTELFLYNEKVRNFIEIFLYNDIYNKFRKG